MAKAGSMGATGWMLCLDESGDFSVEDEPVCVAGVLLRETPSREAEEILRGVLARVDPIVRYPPHATELRLTAWWVAAWARASDTERSAHPRARALEHAAALLARAGDEPELVALSVALREGRRPAYLDLRAASDWMRRRHRTVDDALRGVAREAERRYRQVAATLASRFGPSGCFVVAASDDGGEQPTRDRYLALLEVLLERVYALLRARPAERHVVWVVPAVRDVAHPTLGALPLRAQDVGDCIRRAERFPLDPPDGPFDPWVRLVPAMPVAYDRNTPPGVVLADFIANRCRHPLSQPVAWARLREELTLATGLPVEAVARALPAVPPLPTIASAGTAHRFVARAFGEELPVESPTCSTVWPMEQARRWAEAATALRAGGGR